MFFWFFFLFVVYISFQTPLQNHVIAINPALTWYDSHHTTPAVFIMHLISTAFLIRYLEVVQTPEITGEEEETSQNEQDKPNTSVPNIFFRGRPTTLLFTPLLLL